MRLVIYGAQGVALGAYKAIKTIQPHAIVECFLVTEIGSNASTLGGLPVRELGEFATALKDSEKNTVHILIGTPEAVMSAIEKSLDDVGLHNYVRLDSMRWAKLQELAFVNNEAYMPLAAYLPGNKKPEIHIFKMTHEKDKALATVCQDPEYVQRLQVGTTTSSKQVAELQDNTGDNISDRNGNYSELTGLYWMWKNRIMKQDHIADGYFGLAHYRRFLELSDDDLSRLTANDIDAVLPYPMPYEPNIEAHHLRYLSDVEWKAVLQALEELEPEYAKALSWFLKQEYMYNYNIILAKGKVINEYCRWLFPILFRIEEIINPDGCKVPNRYIGYIGETLESLYFMYNKDKLKTAHAGCRFLC